MLYSDVSLKLHGAEHFCAQIWDTKLAARNEIDHLRVLHLNQGLFAPRLFRSQLAKVKSES